MFGIEYSPLGVKALLLIGSVLVCFIVILIASYQLHLLAARQGKPVNDVQTRGTIITPLVNIAWLSVIFACLVSSCMTLEWARAIIR